MGILGNAPDKYSFPDAPSFTRGRGDCPGVWPVFWLSLLAY